MTRTGTTAGPSLPQHKHVTTVLHLDSVSVSENSEPQKTAMNRPGTKLTRTICGCRGACFDFEIRQYNRPEVSARAQPGIIPVSQ